MSASASNKSSRSLSTLTLIWCSILTFRLIPMGLSGVSTLTVGVQPPTATRVISRLVKSSLVKSLPVQCIRSGPDLAEVRAPEQAQESASRLVLLIDIDIAITLLFAVERRDALRPVFLNSLSLDLAARPASISLPLYLSTSLPLYLSTSLPLYLFSPTAWANALLRSAQSATFRTASGRCDQTNRRQPAGCGATSPRSLRPTH